MIWKECKSLIVSDLERLTNINKWGGGGKNRFFLMRHFKSPLGLEWVPIKKQKTTLWQNSF